MEESKSSERELLVAIKALLKKSGQLNSIQAEMRAKVTEALQNHSNGDQDSKSTPPVPSNEVLLINDLIREYLEWNGYLYTASVMASEANLPTDKRSRGELCAQVGVKDDEKSSALPLLSNIVAAYTERIKRKISKSMRDG